MTQKKKLSSRFLSLFLAVLMIASMIPTTVFAAPASDIPSEMLDNVYLDALAYTGYGVQAQKNDGTIFKTYGSRATAYGSDISYGLVKYGTETVTKSGTATGLAPDIAGFESSGLCCASYVSYVYYNYLPNIAGIDTSFVLYPDGDRVIMSARSIGDTNVQMILEPLGGGGNAATAGAQITGMDMNQVLHALIASIDKYFEE